MNRSVQPDLGRPLRARLQLTRETIVRGSALVCCCLALAAVSVANHTGLRSHAHPVNPGGDTIEMNYLIVTADPSDSTYLAVRFVLDAIGVPNTTLNVAEHTLTYRDLSYGDRGLFQAIVLVLGEGWEAERAVPLSLGAYQALDAYCRRFWIRQLWLVAPPAVPPLLADQTVCATPPGHKTWARVTESGEEVFSSVRRGAWLPVENVGAYHLPSMSGWRPLLVDRLGCWLAFERDRDGLEQLVAVLGHQPGAVHSQLLLGDMLSWAGRGIFLGQRRVYLSAHVDDVLIASSLFAAGQGSPESQQVYRMRPQDLDATVAWQAQLRERYPQLGSFRLDLVFNGIGPLKHGPNDPLTERVKEVKDEFRWVSHTYSHLQMDEASEEDAYAELVRNDEVAKRLDLPSYHSETVVTGEMSGLYNPEFFDGAKRAGVRFVASDYSIADQRSERPNRGLYARYEPTIVLVPRPSLDIYYDATVPEELVDEYNWRHPSGELLTYEKIIDQEGCAILRHMLSFQMNPLMFHQANLRFFDQNGQHSLLSDVLNSAVEEYARLCSLPVSNPSFEEIGEAFRERMRCDEVTVQALIFDWEKVALMACDDVRLPVTGVEAGATEHYAGQPTSSVELKAGRWQLLPIAAHD